MFLTPEQISLISIAVSLLSALLAVWSLNEAKSARTESKKLAIVLRKTELLTGLIDSNSRPRANLLI